MSTPENPLSQYSSYAYHHILLACDTTAIAEALQDSNDLIDFLRISDSDNENTTNDPYNKYKPREFKDKGKYSIIINGMVDAEFIINSVNWTSLVASDAGSSGVDKFSTMMLDGSITIDEPRGIKFMNVMAHVADFLDTDPSGIIFVLKTIFIGHSALSAASATRITSSSIENIDPIVNVRPLIFGIVDISGSFEITGGKYNIEILGINNGASKQPHIMHATDRISLNLNASKGYEGTNPRTLGGALKRLENEINTIYDSYYNKVIQNFSEKNIDFKGRKVKYIIDGEEPYVTQTGTTGNGRPITTPNPEYVIDDFKDQNTDTGEKNDSGIINMSSHKTVESAINALLFRCSKVKNDKDTGDKRDHGENVKWTTKIVSTIESTPDEYRIIFKVRRMVESRTDIIQKILASSGTDSDDIKRNILELDYIFTGKNIDIIDFDIKMEMGLALFQTLITTDSLPSAASAQKGGTPEQGSSAADSDGSKKIVAKENNEEQSTSVPLKIRQNTPIFLSTKLDDKTTKNTNNPRLSGDFQGILNRHAALENIEAQVTIHGNPRLLNSMNKPPSEIINHVNTSQTRANTDGDVFPFWETSPGIVKINIRMPSDSEDKDFSEPFWYQGFYYCFSVENIFSEGSFTQKLTLLSLPQSVTKGKTSQQEGDSTEQQELTNNQNTAGTGNQGAAPVQSSTTTTTTPAENPSGITALGALKSHTEN